MLILTIIGRVATSAYISWGEYNSYGWNSPNTGIDIHASFVTFNGEVGGRANGDLISRSYGSPDTLNSSHAWDVTSSGFVGDDYNYGIIYSSYGK